MSFFIPPPPPAPKEGGNIVKANTPFGMFRRILVKDFFPTFALKHIIGLMDEGPQLNGNRNIYFSLNEHLRAYHTIKNCPKKEKRQN